MMERALRQQVKLAWITGLLLLSATLSFAADLAPLYEKVGLYVPGSRVPAFDFNLEDLGGNKVSLNNLSGKIVLLNFWTTWCKHCVVEMADLDKLQKKYKYDQFVVVAINGGENKEKVKDFITQHNLSFTVLLDQTKKVFRRYRTFALPTTYLVDREGYFLAGALGRLEWNSPDFHRLVQGLLESSGSAPGG